eukprot:scaffold9980_cov121-Isochrysis_galbana.AAC.4
MHVPMSFTCRSDEFIPCQDDSIWDASGSIQSTSCDPSSTVTDSVSATGYCLPCLIPGLILRCALYSSMSRPYACCT